MSNERIKKITADEISGISDPSNERMTKSGKPAGSSRYQTARRKRRRSKRKKKSIFPRVLIIYAVILVIASVAICIWLSSYLKDYESAQPTHVVDDLMDNFKTTEKTHAYILNNCLDMGCLDEPGEFAEAFANLVEGKAITYIENSEISRADAPVYNILADGRLIGQIFLEKDGKSKFNFDCFSIAKVDLVSYFPSSKSIEILVPDGSKVTVNGNELPDRFITDRGVPSALKNSTDFIEKVPEVVTYTIAVVTDPDIKGTDAEGRELKFTANESTYVAGGKATDEFINSVSHLVEKGIEIYGLHFIHMESRLHLYIMAGSKLYNRIFGGEGEEGIDTSLYNYEYIDSYEFTELKAYDYIMYAQDCFSVEVKYTLNVTFTDDKLSDNNQNIDATWVWAKDGDSWSITDVIYH